jgi:hypothetical protein
MVNANKTNLHLSYIPRYDAIVEFLVREPACLRGAVRTFKYSHSPIGPPSVSRSAATQHFFAKIMGDGRRTWSHGRLRSPAIPPFLRKEVIKTSKKSNRYPCASRARLGDS